MTWVVLAGLLGVGGSVMAEDQGAAVGGEEWALTLAERGAEATAAVDRPFDKGSWVLQATGSYVNGEEGFFGDVVEGGTLNLGVGYYFADGWGVYGEVAGAHLDQEDRDRDVDGLGINVLLRWHFLNRENWSLFIDGGGGYVRFEDEFPAFGTHSNFIGRVGLGATYRLTENLHLVGAVRYFHLSNADRHGRDENPSVDAVEGSVGVMWTW